MTHKCASPRCLGRHGTVNELGICGLCRLRDDHTNDPPVDSAYDREQENWAEAEELFEMRDG